MSGKLIDSENCRERRPRAAALPALTIDRPTTNYIRTTYSPILTVLDHLLFFSQNLSANVIYLITFFVSKFYLCVFILKSLNLYILYVLSLLSQLLPSMAVKRIKRSFVRTMIIRCTAMLCVDVFNRC